MKSAIHELSGTQGKENLFQSGILEAKKEMINEAINLYQSNAWDKKYPKLANCISSSSSEQDKEIFAKTVMAMAIQKNYLSRINEATISQNLGEIAPRVLDIMRISFPNQSFHEWIDVQIMKSTHDFIYMLRPIYGKAKAGTELTPGTNPFNISAGERMFQNQIGQAQYSSEEVHDIIGVGNGTDTAFTNAISSTAVRPKSVVVLAGDTQIGEDDGNGNLVGEGIAAASTIDYTGSAAAVVNTTAAVLAGIPIFLKYRVNHETQPDQIGEVDLLFTHMPVTAKAHKLRIKTSVDATLIAEASIGLDVQDSMTVAAAQELKAQKEISVWLDLLRAAGPVNSSLVFNATLSPGTVEVDHAQGFRRKLAAANTTILNKAFRGDARFFIVGTGVEAYMTLVDGYVSDPEPIAIGIYKAGWYRGKPVFVNPYWRPDGWFAGYKGNLFGDVGMILASYLDFYLTQKVEHDDFFTRQGVASFYDKKVINKDYYVQGSITGL